MAVECSGLQAAKIKEASKESQRFNRSLQEYRDRYQFINTASLDNQLKFLKRIQDLCEKKKIELVVVNMPLNRENIKLLAGEFYDDFRTVLKRAVGSRSLFLDSGDENWPQNYYYDSVHLNEIGGSHLNTILADHVVKAAQALGSGDSSKSSAFSGE